jgi:hypothetical protein
MILEVVDAVLAEPDFCAADQPPHQVLGLVAHLHVRWEVEAVLEWQNNPKQTEHQMAATIPK